MKIYNKIMQLLKRKNNKKASNIFVKRFNLFYGLLILGLIIAGILFSYVSIVKKNREIEKEMINHSKTLKNIMKNEVHKIEFKLSHASSRISKFSRSNWRIYNLLSSLSSGFNNIDNNSSSLSWNAYSWINKSDKIAVDGIFGILKNKYDISGRDYLRFTKFTQNKAFLGRPVYGALSKRFIIPIAVGTFNHNKYLGTLVFGLDIDKIRDKLESEINDKNTSFLVFKEGRLLFYSGNIKKSTIENIVNKVKILSLEEGSIEEKLTNQDLFFGGDYISVFKKDANFSVEVAAVYNSEAYKDQITEIILEKMATVCLLALLFFILFKVVYFRIIQPVSHLSEFAKQISKKSFNIKIQKPNNKELNEIYDSLELISHLFAKEESAKKQLIEINKKILSESVSKNDFFQAICRDIRSPIFSISNDVKSLEDLTKNEKIKAIIDNFNENIAGMLQLTEDILDISRTSTGSVSVNKKSKIDILESTNRAIKLCSSFAKKRNVTIKCNNKEDIKAIKLDPKRLRQILVNILTKLIVTSKKEGSIAVNIEEFVSDNRGKLRISIKSNSDHTSLSKESDEHRKNMQKFDMNKGSSGGVSLNIDLKSTKDLVNLMDGVFEMEIKKKEWCLIKLTFKY